MNSRILKIFLYIFLLNSLMVAKSFAYEVINEGRIPSGSGGADLAITNVKRISSVKINNRTSFEITIKNLGTEKADDEYIEPYFYKNGNKLAFHHWSGGSMHKELLPGETEKLILGVEFSKTVTSRTSSFSEIPTRYFDNVLGMTGSNTVGFMITYNNSRKVDKNLRNNERKINISYNFSENKPRISQFENTLNGYSAQMQQPGMKVFRYKLGWNVRMRLSARDDYNILKASLEYRISESSPWKMIETYDVDSPRMTSMKPWVIPSLEENVTGTMQLRIRIYNSPSVFSEALSPIFKVFQNDAIVKKISLDKNKYEEGDKLKLSSKTESVYPIKKVEVTLVQKNNEKEVATKVPSNNKTYDLPSNIEFKIPNNSKFIGDFAYLKVKVINVNGTSYQAKTRRFAITKGGASNGTSNKSILDGASSIISTGESCYYGCDRDTAAMQPHSLSNSTVVFQWLHNEKNCDRLDVVSEQNIDVIIRLKSWAAQYTQKAMKLTLSPEEPITLNNIDLWTTFAITSTSSVNSVNKVDAYCISSNESFKTGNRINLDLKELPSLKDNFVWTGTGSLITKAARNDDQTPFGLTYDYAVTIEGKKSLTTFQWYSTDNCRKIELFDSNKASVAIKDVRMKKWDIKDWGGDQCGNGMLPCTLESPKTNSYYVIKVASDPNVFSGYLAARCVN